ncbi:ATP-binding protein [Brotaphodocola sp.]|uniref:ATP-binding protein n=1 Tax=Brotaphodocola sp. TaxID=3073577 RepID=UPI003D7D7A19
MATKKKQNKLSYLVRGGMTVLTTVLIVLFFCIMSIVGKIQGTARVVNYAGLVRGKTQRIIKLEIAGSPQDEMIESVASFIEGLREGSDTWNLVRLNDAQFQDKLTELSADFDDLREEILKVRQLGYQNTDIIAESEAFFGICDEATGLAEAYSQKKATALSHLEQVVVLDTIGLVILIGIELVKALRYAAMNRILQSKVYLDEATGLPNKNKCEEILGAPELAGENGSTALCVFDLNNLRTINNSLGHAKGDEYIRNFAVELRKALAPEYFVGRDGGDEFLAVLHGLNHEEVQTCMAQIRTHMAEYSKEHPEMPISYAAGYALSDDFPECTMRELFRYADKNMYIDKNQAKMEEATKEKQINLSVLKFIKEKGFSFTDCVYCDGQQDQYRVLRASSSFFLADDGSYSGAVEQIVQELSTPETRKKLWEELQLSYLKETLSKTHEKSEYLCQYPEGDHMRRGRLTILYYDSNAHGELHHFVLGFERFRDSAQLEAIEKRQLTRYYEQMKQSILENSNYVDALLETAEAVYTVDLTNDRIEKIFYRDANVRHFEIEIDLPCSYNEYCEGRRKFISSETMENYRIADSSEKLLERFHTGAKQVAVEYQELGAKKTLIWLQKMILMSRDTVYDDASGVERSVVHGMILFKNTSAFHEQEKMERERLQVAFKKADLESKAKTEFLNRMSHDIRTPINGIMGMVDIIAKNKEDPEKVDACLEKIRLSSTHLLALVSDVLEMSKMEAGHFVPERKPFDIEELMNEVASLIEGQLSETGIAYHAYRENLSHVHLLGSPLHLRQILLNILSNAIKYNKPNGTIDVYTREASFDERTVVYEFKITDSGVGMSEDFVKNRLFEPFSQEKTDARTHYTGTGLGMSIVKEMVAKMNGTIQVQSRVGVGTTFVVAIPFELDVQASRVKNTKNGMGAIGDQTETYSEDGAETENLEKNISKESTSKEGTLKEGTPKKDTSRKELAGKNILLAEDNEINMEIAEFYLTDHGASVDQAWNGQEASEKFAKSAPGAYDVILMDVMMPVMDGLTATRKIRAMEHSDAEAIPILAMTAQSTAESYEECREAGMNGYLTKPINPEVMVKEILRVCEVCKGQ